MLLIDLKHGKEWNKDQTKQWIQKVSYYQNSINSILNLKTLKFGNTTDARLVYSCLSISNICIYIVVMTVCNVTF